MRVIIISNRLPFTTTIRDGKIRFKDSSGGLVTGLKSFLEGQSQEKDGVEFLWMGWPGSSIEASKQEELRKRALSDHKCYPVYLEEAAMENFYHGFCNSTIWPLFHYFPTLAEFRSDYWDEYKKVNQTFMDAFLEIAQPGDAVWVHDYQLMLLPSMIRAQFPKMRIGFFLHIPFPSFEIFRLLPNEWRQDLMNGMMGASLLGFHTYDYSRHFLSCVLRTLGHEHKLGEIVLEDRIVHVDTFPMGIDYERFNRAASTNETIEKATKIQAGFNGRKVIFSVDRLDYTKGILNRLKGYEFFLSENPEWRKKVVFVLVIVPSRTGVTKYQTMKREIDEMVGRINGAYGDTAWSPLIYQFRSMSFQTLVAMYRLSDIGLITPLRDGMNLVAKEYIACRAEGTGVLILSEMAGASKELGEAIVVNPNWYPDIARTLLLALEMEPAEQKQRNEVMRVRLKRYDVVRWVEDFLFALLKRQAFLPAATERLLNDEGYQAFFKTFASAKKRVLLLDYDGTLVPFVGDPKKAVPDEELLSTLRTIVNNQSNDVSIVSGRPRQDLETWFKGMPISLIAEHGAWIREAGSEWKQSRVLVSHWKDTLRPILLLYVDRLPGAHLEEKEFSLAWHWRRADQEQGSIRSHELLEDLVGYTANIDVQVLEGNKVIEVRNMGVTKGTAAESWLSHRSPEVIAAFGDDWTDEDLFRALPPDALTVKVGLTNSAARFHISDHLAVRKLLKLLAKSPDFAKNPSVVRPQEVVEAS